MRGAAALLFMEVSVKSVGRTLFWVLLGPSEEGWSEAVVGGCLPGSQRMGWIHVGSPRPAWADEISASQS